MTVPFTCSRLITSRRSICTFPHGAWFNNASNGQVAARKAEFVGWRTQACPRKEGRADKGGEQEPTGRGRDKSACHAVIQAAVAACLLACRAVGRWQVLRFYPGNSGLRSAQYVFIDAGLPGETDR